MEGRISATLKDKLSAFDIREPYVWRLKLSASDFEELEAGIKAMTASGPSELAKPENACATIIYIAEWYKRKYQSGSKNALIDGLNLETLWLNSGISIKSYVYLDEGGNKRWLYSTYVLGGLAIQHELHRNDGMRFLKGLCRIYHGEAYTLENLDDAARAIAFRESIKQQHSLYEYMRQILNGDMPFADSDLQDGASSVNRFVAAIKAANDEVLSVKFRFEWVVNFSREFNFMNRRLNIWFKPEEVGGGLYQYLRYDRVHLWGVPNPESLEHLYIYIRFRRGDQIVEPSTMEKPIITYLNHGVNDFVAFGAESGVSVRHIPTCRFTHIDLVAKDDSGKEYIAQTLEATEYLQLWRTQDYSDNWSSTPNSQKETALVFSNKCQLSLESAANDVYRKSFRDEKFSTSELWNWLYIYDKVTFADSKGKEISLYNRVGYDQVTTRLYPGIIHYFDGGKVGHFYIDDPDISEELDVEYYPLVFSPQDIIVRHFSTKDDIRNANPESDAEAELVEYKASNGRYEIWDSSNAPSYGVCTLRVSVKGRYSPMTVIYLPSLAVDHPIIRDFEATAIRYRNLEGAECSYQDCVPLDGVELEPTRPIVFGVADDYCQLDVFRPTQIKEVFVDGKFNQYFQAEDFIDIPYILKSHIKVNDFRQMGYQSYECAAISGVFAEPFINISGNPNAGMAALFAWHKGTAYRAQLLDPLAPPCLNVVFGLPKGQSDWTNVNALSWNYDVNQEPEKTNFSNIPGFGIVFQCNRQVMSLKYNYPIQNDDDPWGFESVEVSLVKCFEVANATGVYFFLMKPFINLSRQEYTDLYNQLMQERSGILTEEDTSGLKRFAEEFNFDWSELGITIDNE